MASPSRQSYRDLPIAVIPGVDTVGDINGILQAHDYGILRNSALLVDAMMRDDRIAGCMNTRTAALLAAPVECKPASQKRKAGKIAEEVGGSDEQAGVWDAMFPASVVGGLSFWGEMLGIGLAEIIWETGEGAWFPRLKLWHPQFLWWDWGSFRWRLNTRDGVIDLPHFTNGLETDGHWVMWCPNGYQYGWLHGLVRSLANKYLMRQ